MNAEPIRSRRRRSSTASLPVYDSLRSDILSGRLMAGTPLLQDDIAREYGVSQMPVQEALMKLEAEGYVLIRQSKGASVRGFSIDELLNLMDVRVALECRALAMAIPNQVRAELEQARVLLERYARGSTPLQWCDMNQSFHRMLYEPCANPQLLAMITDIQRRIGPAGRLLVTRTSGRERPSREHTEILQACIDGDVKRAVACLDLHITTTRDEIAARVRRAP